MEGFISTIQEFIDTPNNKIIEILERQNKYCEQSQIKAWGTLIADIKNSTRFNQLDKNLVVALEYKLPVDNMAIDFIIVGLNEQNTRSAIIIESKQWDDHFIKNNEFGEYGHNDKKLHPQVQVSKQKLAFIDYTSAGPSFTAEPVVFIRNCSAGGIHDLYEKNPNKASEKIKIYNDLDEIFNAVSILKGDRKLVKLLKDNSFEVSKNIVNKMESIAKNEEPFILNDEQFEVLQKILQEIQDGNRLIIITGSAGSGKTAIMLNLYIYLLNQRQNTQKIRFISEAQNTWFYKERYPMIQNVFSFSNSLPKKGENNIILLDEAQHNSPGIITYAYKSGATVILCYDYRQVINATNNAVPEIEKLKNENTFIEHKLTKNIRNNGSQNLIPNIDKLLNGDKNFVFDDKFELKIFDLFKEFEEKYFSIIEKQPDNTVAITGLLCADASDLLINNNAKMFIDWGNKGECKWLPYILDKEYLSKYNGNAWIGTWWMPGLDVDYIFLFIGSDIKYDENGFNIVLEQSKHERLMISVAESMKLPKEIFAFRKDNKPMNGKTVKNIIEYINKPKNKDIKEDYIKYCNTLIKNVYYIMLTRGCKGCYIFFANDTTKGANI